MRARPLIRKPLPPKARRVAKVMARLCCPRCLWRSRQRIALDGRVHRCPKCEASIFALQEQPPVYFHGGQRGLAKGALLLPRDQTGAPGVIRERTESIGLTRPDGYRQDFLYLTTRWDVAVMFAVLHPSVGQVYLVETPVDLEPDPACPEDGVSFRTRQARVRRVLEVEAHELIATVRTLDHFTKKVEAKDEDEDDGNQKTAE